MTFFSPKLVLEKRVKNCKLWKVDDPQLQTVQTAKLFKEIDNNPEHKLLVFY